MLGKINRKAALIISNGNLPSGLVKLGESEENAVIRIVYDTVKLKVKTTHYIDVDSEKPYVKYYFCSISDANSLNPIKGENYLPLGLVLQDEEIIQGIDLYILSEAQRLWEISKGD